MNKKRTLFAIIMLFLGVGLVAQPCMPGWKYMKRVTLANVNGALTDFQVLVENINTSALVAAGKMAADGRDIRFVSSAGVALPYWVENGTFNTSNTRVWVKVNTIAASPDATDIYLFYGNNNAFPFADGAGTFELFDDFTGSVSGNWDVCNPSRVTFTNGQAVFTTNAPGEKVLISTRNGFNGPVIAGLKVVSFTGSGAGKIAFLAQHDGSQNGYAQCYTPTTNNLDIRPFSANADCFTPTAPAFSASFNAGNNFWQMRWISATWQRATAQGSGIDDDVNYAYNQHPFPASIHASVGVFNDAGVLTADWFFIRKYAASDVTVSAVGAEDALPAMGNVIVTNNSPLCAGASLTLSADDIAGATFAWSKDGGAPVPGRTYMVGSATPADAGNYTLTITPASPNPCPSYQVFEKVLVYPTTVAGSIIGAPVNVCYGNNTGILTLTGQTGQVKRWEYSLTGGEPWTATGNTSLTQSYTNLTSTTSFRAVVQSGTCTEQITPAVTVTVDALPVAGAITGAKLLCKGQDITLTLTGYTGTIVKWMQSADSALWTDYASTQASVTFTGLAATTWYKVEVAGGTCSTDTTLAVKVVVSEPTLAGSFSGATVCRGSSGSLLLAGHNGNVLRWEMSLTGGNPWTTIASTTAGLNYDKITQTTWYRAVVQNGACNVETSAVDTVLVDQPVVAGKVTGSDTVCTGTNTGKLSLQGYSGVVSKWQSSADGASWADFANARDTLRYTNLSSKVYYRAYLNSLLGACSPKTSDSAFIAVSAATVSGSVLGSDNICASGNKGTLKLNGQTGSVIRWERSPAGNDPWFVIANATDSLPYLNLPETTFYRAIVKSGRCAAMPSTSASLTVTQPSEAGIITGTKSACSKNNDGSLILIGLTGEVKKWQQSTDLVTWKLAVNTVPTELLYKDLPVTTHYRTIVQNGICPADTTPKTTITIYPLPVVNFNADTADLGKPTHFTNLSTIPQGKLVTFDWDFGNGYSSSAKNPVLVYSTSGTFEVKLNVTSDKGCLDSIKGNVLVSPLPKPGFEFANVCFKDTVRFKNTSTMSGGTMYYKWYFGDGTVSEDSNAKHYYTSAGTYYVKLVVNSDNGTRDSITREVTVYPRSAPNFTFTNVCNGKASAFTNKSVISNGNLTHQWSFGDGAVTLELNPAHEYKTAGKFAVQLISTSGYGCADTIVKTVTVFPLPSPSFSCANVPYNQLSYFIDSSKVQQGAIVKWDWNFGDTQTASIQSPSHKYNAPGIFLATLKVATDSGCINTFSRNVEVYALPNAAFSFADVCEKDTVRFVNTSSIPAGTLTYLWDFGDFSTSTVKEPAHYYGTPGVYKVTLFVTSDNDGKDTLVRNVTIHPKPVPDFIAPGVCEGVLTLFKNTSTVKTGSLSSYSWDFGEGSGSVQVNPEKQFLNPGTYQVTLKVVTNKGCSAGVTKPVEMYLSPIANFAADHVCLGTKVKFSNMSVITKGSLQYQWLFGDGGNGMEMHPEHWYATPDTFRVKLTAISNHNCTDSVIRKVIVRTAPKVNAGKDTSVVKGFSVRLRATGGVVYDWGPTESLDNPVIADPMARPRETTMYKVRIRNEYNCESSDSVLVSVRDDQRLIPTNIITPDGDGVNDTWRITNIDFYEQATIRIFNRWGEQVYNKTAYLQDWDGKNSNGDVLPDGTYYYVITFPDTTRNYTGAITILRNK